MRTIITILIVFVITFSSYFILDVSPAGKANLALCCNDKDPRLYPGTNTWSWLCLNGQGGNSDLLLSREQCLCVWELNNWQPPVGMPCSALQMCTNR